MIETTGPLRFDELVQVGLYDADHGFYATTGRAGRWGGDFITSPEVGPLFGAVVARALDARWTALGRPDQFCVVEAAAGRGTLARSIRLAAPACAAALDYVMVDVSAPQRALHADLGSPFRSAESLPDHADVILANELLDNLAFRIARLVPGDASPTPANAAWSEILIDVQPGSLELSETSAPLDRSALTSQLTTALDTTALNTTALDATALDATALDATAATPPGERIADGVVEVPLAERAHAWVADACTRAGLVLVFDYGAATAELAARPNRGWLRTYRENQPGSAPLQHLGHQDITIDVPFDQLPPATRQRTQGEFLRHFGIEELVAEGRRIWEERAALGDLAAIRARSRTVEAEALLDPRGLGGFVVLEWETDHPSSPN